jgi:hypothetical protein
LRGQRRRHDTRGEGDDYQTQQVHSFCSPQQDGPLGPA